MNITNKYDDIWSIFKVNNKYGQNLKHVNMTFFS